MNRGDGQGLPRPAEQDLLVGEEPAEPDRVHRDAVDVGAAGAVQGLAVASGWAGHRLLRGPRRSTRPYGGRCR